MGKLALVIMVLTVCPEGFTKVTVLFTGKPVTMTLPSMAPPKLVIVMSDPMLPSTSSTSLLFPVTMSMTSFAVGSIDGSDEGDCDGEEDGCREGSVEGVVEGLSDGD